jgi:Na+-translocating ferredoxin:NAD+ oxidoreductase RnfG subunit
MIFCSFSLPKNIQKKVEKQISKTFAVKNFELQPMIVADSINHKLKRKIGNDHLFKITSDKKELLGYAYVDKAPSKTDEFDYLILLNKELIVTKIKVLIYREDYGGEIGSKRWLKQFKGLKSSEKVTYEKDIIPISGATISAYAMTAAVNTFLQDLSILIENQIF